MNETESLAASNRSAVAVENTLLQLVNRLVELRLLSIDDGMSMLSQLARANDLSAARVAPSMTNLKRLKARQGGNSGLEPESDGLA